ncbi:NAD-dependent epimerase/dehydratase family protein [Streptomyces sp. NPDC014773]|uniref:NAD-dependent epimerase/dehydratase family protein n=1 Tax=Streptomyces sp. NPDC014773 TaxID=3364908 RepID=UPI0036F8D357
MTADRSGSGGAVSGEAASGEAAFGTAAPGEAASGGAGPGSRTALVVGGAGFVGRHAAAALAGGGFRVLTLGRAPRPGALRADLAATAPGELAALLDRHRVDLVVNAAGAVWGGLDEETVHRANVTLVRTLVEAVAVSARAPRLVQLGSGYEYGPTPEGASVTEDAPARPTTPYGRTKLLATRTVLAAAEEGRIDGVVLRVASALGPGAPAGSLFGALLERLRAAPAGGPPAEIVLRPLVSRQDFVDVRDVGAAVCRAATAAPGAARLLNIGGGRAVPVRDLVRHLVGLSGAPVRITERDDGTGARGGGLDWQLLDTAAARAAWGWTPARGPENALHDLWHH